uniref:BTB domain-containing protein n=1 Tax=Steinernema glaseri TaxID=37863 RepID=A0A1I7ZZH9_9BILA
MDSVEIPDVSHDEFVDFLRVIYPSHKEVTEDNVESLLRLADRFDVPFVTERCEDFLLTTDHFSLAEKLLISGQFQLCRLENQCLKEVNSLADLRHVSEAPEAALLTDFTKVSLYERMVRLSKEREEATVPLPPRPSAISYKVTHTPSFVF